MKKTGVLVVSLIIISLIFVISTPVSTASHTTCLEDESAKAYCGVPIDWMDIFEQTDGPASSSELNDETPEVRGTMASDANSQYRRLYQGLGIVLNPEIENALTGRTRQVDEADAFWKGAYFDNNLGFPPYRYQVHIWDNGANGCEWIDRETETSTDEDVDNQQSYMKIEEGSNFCGQGGGPNPSTVYGPLINDNGGEDNSELNKFEFDTVIANVEVPQNSRIIINIYEEEERNRKVAEAVFKSSNSRVDTIANADVTVEEQDVSEYDGDYYISVEMEKDGEEVSSPKFGGRILLARSYPEFRESSLPYSKYPNTLERLNSKMYENYQNKYFRNVDNAETSTSPRLDESKYADGKIDNPNTFAELTESTSIFQNAYVDISNINPSVLTPNTFIDEPYDLDGNWNRVIDEEGQVYVTYDSGVNSPSRQNDFSGSPSDGDFRWTYEYDEDDIEYNIEFGYKYIDTTLSDTGPSSTDLDIVQGSGDSTRKRVLEEITADEPGVKTFDYSVEDDNINEIYKFYADMEAIVTYNIDYEQYVVVEEDCPPDQDDSEVPRPGPQSGTYNPYDGPSGCEDSSDDYVVSEGWENYEGSPSGKSSELTLSTTDSNVMESDEEQKLEADSKPVVRTETQEFEEDDFEISRLHGMGIENNDRLLFNRTKDEDLEDTRWTRIVGKSISQDGTVQIYSSSQRFEHSLSIPTIPSINDGEYGFSQIDIGRNDDGSINTEDINLNTNYAVDGTIDETDNVTVDVFVSGPVRPADRLSVYVEDNKAGQFEVPFSGTDGDGYETVTDLDTLNGKETLNISEYTRGESSSVNLEFMYEGSEITSPVRVDYVMEIETGQEINQFKSRWSYATFRDSRWDVIYTHNKPCHEEDNCYEYSKHGIPIADDKINNGETRGFPNEGGVPDSVDYTYPSGVLPVNAYLVPTTDTLLTQRSPQSNTVLPPVATDEPRSPDELNDIAVDALRNDEPRHYFREAEVKTPMVSNLCAKGPVPNQDDEWRNYCDLYSGYLANNTVESKIINRVPSSASFNELYSNENYRTGDTRETIEDEQTNPLSLSRQISYSDYSPLRNEGTSEYKEMMSFETILDREATGWRISGDANWETKDVDIQKNEYIMHSTNMNVRAIENPRESLSEEKINELNSERVNHQILPENHQDGVYQFRIRLEDEYGNPVSIVDRRYGENGASGDVQKISVSNSRPTIQSGGSRWVKDEFMTNDDGVVYVTVNISDSYDNQFSASYDGNKGDWWMHQDDVESDSTKRLLSSSESVRDFSDSDNNPQSNQNLWKLFTGVAFVVLGFLFVLSRAIRTYPDSNMTTRDLIGLLVDPFWDEIKELLVYLISLFILVFVGLLVLGALTGNGETSIFRYINLILDAFMSSSS